MCNCAEKEAKGVINCGDECWLLIDWCLPIFKGHMSIHKKRNMRQRRCGAESSLGFAWKNVHCRWASVLCVVKQGISTTRARPFDFHRFTLTQRQPPPPPAMDEMEFIDLCEYHSPPPPPPPPPPPRQPVVCACDSGFAPCRH
jgi:hypothetical protein